jgi:hypothetical protein
LGRFPWESLPIFDTNDSLIGQQRLKTDPDTAEVCWETRSLFGSAVTRMAIDALGAELGMKQISCRRRANLLFFQKKYMRQINELKEGLGRPQ